MTMLRRDCSLADRAGSLAPAACILRGGNRVVDGAGQDRIGSNRRGVLADVHHATTSVVRVDGEASLGATCPFLRLALGRHDGVSRAALEREPGSDGNEHVAAG
jgi:hypothetical protein